MTPEELNKACEWLEKYMESLGYIDEWCRNGEDDFRKAMSTVIKESLTTAENNAESRFIDKGCEWLDNTLPDIEYITNASALRQNKKQFIDTFRKAMGAVVKDSLTAVEIDGKRYKVGRVKPVYEKCDKCSLRYPCCTGEIEPPCEVHNLDESGYFESAE